VSFDCVDNRGWPGESDRAQLIATEPPRREALRAVIRDVLTLASHSPDVLLQPGAMESAEESILRAADHALHPASRGLEGKRTNLSQYLSLVRTFDEFLAANAGRTVYSADVAKQLGVSVRTLQRSARNSRHEHASLHAAAAALERTSATGAGTSACIDQGDRAGEWFWHLGEFLSH
jgi:AraC family ethanolamine operon transcriptional activator